MTTATAQNPTNPFGSSNPFDDDDEPASSGMKAASSAASNPHTNPFGGANWSQQAAGERGGAAAAATTSNSDNNSAAVAPTETDLDDDDDDDADLPPSTTSPEATWQYLGDLPYRRVPIYSSVQWKRRATSTTSSTPQDTATGDWQQHGLASFPIMQTSKNSLLTPREVRAWLQTSTVTHVKGCPHGGPLAVVTLPVMSAAAASASSNMTSHRSAAELRILTNSGQVLAQLPLPPTPLQNRYAAVDVLTIGFTSRTTLVVVMRDSLCLTYNLRGQALLAPFYIMPSNTSGEATATSGGGGCPLQQAVVYQGGVAVLGQDKNAALVELLDDNDDPAYLQSAHLTARQVTAMPGLEHMDNTTAAATTTSSQQQHYALVTPLPTAQHAATHYCSYLTLAVLDRTRTNSQHPEIFLSTSDCSVVVVEASTLSITDVDIRNRMASAVVDMSFAPNGRFLACFTESAMLTVISTSFETKVLDFDTSEGSSTPPQEMQWCGEDSVVLHWKNLGVLMVGPYGDWLRFPYQGTENLYIVPEMDCCRVITDSAVEILQRVPPTTADLLRIGSIETAAMLLDASDAFHAGSPTSDETARAILEAGHLEQAVQTCIEAATKEFDIWTQKRLLRAASYGMHFSYKTPEDATTSTIMGGPTFMASAAGGGGAEGGGEEKATPSSTLNQMRPSALAFEFVTASRKLRILNALRNPRVGFLATCAQYDAMSPTGVVARLIAMKRPSLACSISSYLSLPKSVQLFARASKAAALVETDMHRSDTEVAEAAMRIINGEAGGDKNGTLSEEKDSGIVATGVGDSRRSNSINRGGYATVAMAANKAGRTGVANLLLMLESSVADKVPALISTGSYADAMAVATNARDADFIFMTLMEYERAVSSEDVAKAQSTFLGTVVSKFTPEGFHTLRRYLETTPDIKSVTNLLLRAQRFSSAGAAMAQRALQESDIREKQGMLAESSRIFGLGKETAFHKSSTDDYLELLRDQELLRTKYGAHEVAPESSSVTCTIASVIRFASTNVREQHRLLSDAEKLGKKYRVPERRYWHIKVKAYADSGQWSNLRLLADSRAKSPVGFKPFARAAIRGKQNSTEILKYIDRVTVPEERYDLLCGAHLWKKALEEAGRMRDTRRVLNVKTLCNSSEIQLLADEMMGRMA